MNPIIAKIIIIFVMTIMFAICIATGYMFYHVVIKPLFIRLFRYRQILFIAQNILTSKDKVQTLIELNIKEKDIIRITEEEILKVQSMNKEPKIIEILNKIWRKIKDGKKPTSKREHSRGEDKGEIGKKPETKSGSKAGTIFSRVKGEISGRFSKQSGKSDTTDAEHRTL